MSPLTPSDLGLILSYHCQAACDHCLYNCGPDWKDWMKPDEVVYAMEATTFWSHPYQIHITGGEPFLNFPLLLHAVEEAAQIAPVYVETNASWCVREQLVDERLRALKQAGLAAILISCSPFHAKTIPLERTALALRKALDLFGPHQVILYLPEWYERLNVFDQSEPVGLDEILELTGGQQAGRELWNGYGLMGGGRCGVKLGHLVPGRPAEAFAGQTCRMEILHAPHSHFDLYGNFIPAFCGGISAGSWADLRALTQNAVQEDLSPFLTLLIREGPYGLCRLAERDYGFQPEGRTFADKCHLCVEVRCRILEREAVPEFSPKEFYTTF